METFGQRLKDELSRKGMTQKQLAFEISVSEWAVSVWVHDKATPNDENVRLIAETLGCDAEYLLTGKKANPNEPKRNGSGYYDPTAYNAIKNVGETKMEYKRGDVFYVRKANDTEGSEQEAGRPAVIVSNDTGNKFSQFVEVVYLTTAGKKMLPTHVKVKGRLMSTALCEQISSVSKSRLEEYIRSCTDEEMEEIDKALMVSIGLEKTKYQKQESRDAEMDDLRMRLEGAEREISEKNSRIMELEDENNRIRLYAKEVSNDDELRKTEIERDLYKRMYEQLLERMIGRTA